MKFAIVRTVIADAAMPADGEFTARGAGDDAQRAAFGIATEQGALRPLQDFDPLDVEQCRVEAVLATEIDAVDVDADALLARRLVGIERNDPADPDRQRRLARLEGGDAKARDRAVG